MKILLIILVALLPLHALIITFLKCKLYINTDIIRFWKEIIIIILLFGAIFEVLRKYKFSLTKIYKNNYLLGVVTAFIISSLTYIYFPFFELKLSGLLGFKYDIFFLFTLIIGLYLSEVKKNLDILIKVLFGVIGIILVLFLPWYLIGDISSLSTIFGYSSEVSTYEANSCISFAQNVNGQNRFQGTFGGPIRFSVFLTIFYFLYIGFILDKGFFINISFKKMFEGNKNIFINIVKNIVKNKKYMVLILLLLIPSLFVITSIFFSYSKTSILGLIFGFALLIYLIRKIIFKKKINTKFIGFLGILSIIPIILITIFKKDLFLHLGAIINRFDNLSKSIEMFFYNPIGYGLGIAGPASQIGNSIESAGSWEVATSTVTRTHTFLPENWYIQILLEQGIIGLSLFISILIIIGVNLLNTAKNKKDYMGICLFVSFCVLCFMALFTHSFEESATSYILFLIIGVYIARNKMAK